MAREEEMDEYDNQALTTHTKQRKNKEEHSRKEQKDISQLNSLVVIGHFVKKCPKKEKWKDDMILKYQSIIQNDVWI